MNVKEVVGDRGGTKVFTSRVLMARQKKLFGVCSQYWNIEVSETGKQYTEIRHYLLTQQQYREDI